ncbi:MAG: hypothetical protein Q8S21_00815 [Candidatus Paracaedibacteraceae bacterium]|nr:hypothetical protein [Candidatus Paracaedibacteraceae bacterium]
MDKDQKIIINYFCMIFCLMISKNALSLEGFIPVAGSSPVVLSTLLPADLDNAEVKYDSARGLYYREINPSEEIKKNDTAVVAKENIRIIACMGGSLTKEAVIIFEHLTLNGILREGFSLIAENNPINGIQHCVIKRYILYEDAEHTVIKPNMLSLKVDEFYEDFQVIKFWDIPKNVGFNAKILCIKDYENLWSENISDRQKSRIAQYADKYTETAPILTMAKAASTNVKPPAVNNLLYAAGILYDCQIFDLRSGPFFVFQTPLNFIETIKNTSYKDKEEFDKHRTLSLTGIIVNSFFEFWPSITNLFYK